METPPRNNRFDEYISHYETQSAPPLKKGDAKRYFISPEIDLIESSILENTTYTPEYVSIPLPTTHHFRVPTLIGTLQKQYGMKNEVEDIPPPYQRGGSWTPTFGDRLTHTYKDDHIHTYKETHTYANEETHTYKGNEVPCRLTTFEIDNENEGGLHSNTSTSTAPEDIHTEEKQNTGDTLILSSPPPPMYPSLFHPSKDDNYLVSSNHVPVRHQRVESEPYRYVSTRFRDESVWDPTGREHPGIDISTRRKYEVSGLSELEHTSSEHTGITNLPTSMPPSDASGGFGCAAHFWKDFAKFLVNGPRQKSRRYKEVNNSKIPGVVYYA